MQTHFPIKLLETSAGQEADRILRSCVHCGFCTATCPTYLLTGNELDSPRGRIYLVKELLETGESTLITRTHLERCLSCQACESTCPSNVDYHTLLNIGRDAMEHSSPKVWLEEVKKTFFLKVLGSASLFSFLLRLGKVFRIFLPASLSRQLPGKSRFSPNPAATAEKQKRNAVLLNGCVQSSLTPDTNLAATLVLGRLGIGARSIQQENCCGAMHFHTGRQEAGLGKARQLIDQLVSEIDAGAEAIISTASGCGNFIKDYKKVFRNDKVYLGKVSKLDGFIKDISEYLINEDLSKLNIGMTKSLAFHSPCTLQHGQGLAGRTEALLTQLGFKLPEIEDAHLCCGSAGTYSLFQPSFARQLRNNKIKSLEKNGVEEIATANVGCQCHLAGGTSTNVRHWIEYVAQALKHEA